MMGPVMPNNNLLGAQSSLGSPAKPRSFHMTAGRRNGLTFDKTGRLPEFSLKDKVFIVSGAGRGLGLVQSEALLEAGAKGGFQFVLFLCNGPKGK